MYCATESSCHMNLASNFVLKLPEFIQGQCRNVAVYNMVDYN